MNVTVAKSAGFCFGVKRAVEMAENLSAEGGHLYTFGPIIHNEEVINELKEKGIVPIEADEELENAPKGKIIIRSHGVSKLTYEKLEKLGFEVLDATCPFVKKIHNYVEEYSAKNYHIIIVGDKSHPEVMGIKGWCVTDKITVVADEEEAKNLKVDKDEAICVVSQTTYNPNKFEKIVEIIEKMGYHNGVCILKTVCSATETRQSEAKELATKSDTMIVIGGKGSSNTKKLYDVCKNECKSTYYIQTLKDLLASDFSGLGNVGITAGASTPNKIIEEVQKYVRDEL